MAAAMTRRTRILCAMPLCLNRIAVTEAGPFPAYCETHADKALVRVN